MKLHLPKVLKVALLAVIGISSISTVAVADTTLGGVTYTGDVYTWSNTTGSQADLAYGGWKQTTEVDGVYTYGAEITAWAAISPLITTGNNTIRFDAAQGSNTNMKYTFTPLAVTGVIVESGSTGYTINASGGNRAVYIGKENGTARSDISADFTIKTDAATGDGSMTFRGTQTWNLANDATFTLNSGSKAKTVNGQLSITGSGTVDMVGTGVTTITQGSAINVGTGSTLNLSGTVNVVVSGGAGGETARDRSDGNGWGHASYSGVSIGQIDGTLGASGVTWQVNGTAAEFDSNTNTLSYEGDSSTYYFYEAVTSASDAAGATKVIVDTLSTDKVVELGDGTYTWSSLTIESGMVTTTHNDGNGCVKNGDIAINAGGILKVAGGHDAFGYNAGACTKSITLEGQEGKIAELQLAQTTANSVTMKTNIIMNGNAAITGEKGFNTYGCSISATGTNNRIDRIDLRENVSLTTAANAELTVGKFTLNNAGEKKLTLRGTGTLTVEAASNFKEVELVGTKLILNADASMTKLSTANGSSTSTVTIGEAATVNIAELANSWGINTITVNGTLNVTTSFVISTGGMVNTINGKGTINAESLKVTNVTTKAAFSGVTLNLGSGGVTTDTTKPIEFGTMTVGVMEGADGWSATVNQISLADASTGTTFAPGADKTITISGNMGGSGKLVKAEAGTLVLSGTNTYSGGTTVNGGTLSAASAGALGTTGTVSVTDGTLEIGATMDLGTRVNQTGGTISVTADGNLTLGASTINAAISNAGTVALTGTIADAIAADAGSGTSAYTGISGEATTAEGNYFLGTTASTVTIVTGDGSASGTVSYKGGSYELGADGKITTTGASADYTTFYMNDSSSTCLVSAIAAAAETLSSNTQELNKVSMTDGTLNVDQDVANVVANGGTVNLNGGNVTTKLEVAENATVNGAIDAEKVTIDAGKTATMTDGVSTSGVTIGGTTGATVQNTGSENAAYSLADANAKVTADSLVANSAEDVTVSNQLVVNRISNTGEGSLEVTQKVEGLTTLAATVGDVTLKGVEAQVTLATLSIGENNAVSIFTGADAQTQLTEATVTVTGNLTSAAGSDLYANLVIGADSVVTLADTLTLHSDVGVAGKFTLAGDLATDLKNLAEGGQVTLIQGDNLTYSGILANGQDASVILKDVAAGDYTVVADGSVLAIQKTGSSPVVPEPATGTLSLLALAGLMARRRRK